MSPQILPSPAIDPDVLPSCLHGGWTLQVLDKGMRAFIERQPIVCEYMRVSTLHRSRLPAPDVVQLEEDARLHLKINFWFCFLGNIWSWMQCGENVLRKGKNEPRFQRIQRERTHKSRVHICNEIPKDKSYWLIYWFTDWWILIQMPNNHHFAG